MKKSFYSQQADAHRSQRAESAATKSFDAKQQGALHQGRKATPNSAPLKSQSKQSTGGYVGGNPFKGLK